MKSYKYDPDVKVYDISLTESYFEEDDEWYGIIEKGDHAVDFNYYVERGEQQSAFYPCYMGEDGYINVDTSQWKYYNVDFTDSNWKEKLIQAAYEYLIEIGG